MARAPAPPAPAGARARGSVQLVALALLCACLWTRLQHVLGDSGGAIVAPEATLWEAQLRPGCDLQDGCALGGDDALSPGGWGGARRRGAGAQRAAAPRTVPAPGRTVEALRGPLCALAARRRGVGRGGVAARACAALSPPAEQVFEDFAPGVAAWRAHALGAFILRTAAVAAIVLPCTRAVLDPAAQALGRRCLRSACDDADVTFLKWREACWKLVVYACLSALGAAACAREPWLHDTAQLWSGWPAAQAHGEALCVWYALEAGLYAYGLVDLLLWEAARGDYYAMILHHVATLGLLGGSFAFGFLRIGAAVMMLNDFVDLWFEGAKLAKYAGRDKLSGGLYLGFVATWAVLRQLYCPLLLCYSTLLQAWDLVARHGPTTRHVSIWAAFNAGMLVLQGLHTYWFVFLLQKIEFDPGTRFGIRVVDRRPCADAACCAAAAAVVAPCCVAAAGGAERGGAADGARRRPAVAKAHAALIPPQE